MKAWFAQRPWRRAIAWLVLLGPLFYATYGFANWWAATRAGVPTLAFDWERGIPFWPWTIFPYWTINVFYALSLFLARDRHTMDRHALRLVTATVIAVSCFVAWPLRFSFGQPPVSGAPAFLFDALRGFDQPFNQAPSLHIALAVILWDWYRQFIRPLWARLVLHVWAFAICASVLTTWQHHVIDIPTGALLGLVCVWLWPLERVASIRQSWRVTRDPQRWKLASFYGVGALIFLGAALAIGGFGLWLCWPAASLALVGLNYAALGARGFQMDNRGRMRWAAGWLFAPYRLGAAINAWAWTRRLPPSVEVAPGLRLGRIPTRDEWVAAGRPRLVSLCAELQLPRVDGARCVPMLDLVVPPPHRLQRAASVIDAQRRTGHTVWVCCALGFSRSAAATIAWLRLHGHSVSVGDAEAQVRRARPQIVLRAAWQRALDHATRHTRTP
ncbi:phosphatase PAP2/dual specificity phosphatase family protein [Variovorax arabinosiphilus]|uniref:phosphatase PAP2/dual specificity phosphatase family protein n=1 Tax=Variovorax arabinosiphilus TaxID=3053498 RepID=UPI0025767AAC|nr:MULTISPECIES: phosphatase PAP2/dual specificity phosphatase family protein [unclassified Variovorax]MDM0123456.1 phosphatase PAP2/dual specificity phosphatase family protein [Variovorax sp. J2L1-78]MDM0132515.1 phosphatase PAP2/dual specificity phosphatase family protein [Variovorax sp. J2L1-63]MDM0236294.1 phosphatase PAP2/dual specificity phosphatase family protein [Variovorax sp. J2R1-6]